MNKCHAHWLSSIRANRSIRAPLSLSKSISSFILYTSFLPSKLRVPYGPLRQTQIGTSKNQRHSAD